MGKTIKTLKFIVGNGHKMKIDINQISDSAYFEARVISGDSGTGTISGGTSDLDQFCSEVIEEHKYSYNFFNKGYKAAKDAHSN